MRGNPRIDTPDLDPDLHPNPDPERSLVEDLGDTVDELRQLYTDFGMRPYRVFSVVYLWTGGAIGRGEAIVESEKEFLPTPWVDTKPVRSDPRSGGIVERGMATLREVSPRLTEDEISDMCGCEHRDPARQTFIEVTMDARDGSSKRRRFAVAGVPYRNAGGFEWEVQIVRQDQDRERDGRPPTPARR